MLYVHIYFMGIVKWKSISWNLHTSTKNDEVYAARKFSEHTKQGDVEKAPPLTYNFGCPC